MCREVKLKKLEEVSLLLLHISTFQQVLTCLNVTETLQLVIVQIAAWIIS